MKINKYKDYNKKNYKFILIVIFVMIFILFIGILSLKKIEKNIEQPEISYDSLSSIKDVIEYHKSKYISEKYSSENGYYLDVYVKFRVPLYNDDGESNETYFNNLLEDSARILYYNSFIMIDETREITIKVICDKTKIKNIIINDMEDYFIYMDSQNSMKKYKEIEITNFSISSEILQTCIDNNWKSDIYFGERDSIYNEYNIYFDEGIEVRIIDGKIYNIIFTEKYNGNIINNLFPGIDFQSVEANLGEPTFKDEKLNVIGYKGEKVYTFFTENEISIYRNSTIDSDDFFELADKFIAENMDLLEFMNELTYLWPDYSEYEYDSTSLFISYPLKGIEIAINSGDINGILVYNNNKSTLSKISRYLENTNFVGKLQIDSVFEAEKRRFEKENNLLSKCDEYMESLSEETKEILGESMDYKIFAKKDENGYIYEMNFISKYGDNPNRQLVDNMNYYLWLTNDYFLYSKSGKGIFFYNLKTGKVQRIITGDEEYKLKGYENGILKFDNEERQLQF